MYKDTSIHISSHELIKMLGIERFEVNSNWSQVASKHGLDMSDQLKMIVCNLEGVHMVGGGFIDTTHFKHLVIDLLTKHGIIDDAGKYNLRNISIRFYKNFVPDDEDRYYSLKLDVSGIAVTRREDISID